MTDGIQAARRAVLITLIVSGSVTNLMMICTVITKRLRRKGYGQYLACLAIAVIVYLVLMLVEEVDGVIRDVAKHNMGVRVASQFNSRMFSNRSANSTFDSSLTNGTKQQPLRILGKIMIDAGKQTSLNNSRPLPFVNSDLMTLPSMFYYYNTPACCVWRFIKTVLPIIESWSIVCLSVERFLVVAMPRKCGHVCSRNISLLVIFAIIASACVSQSFIFFMTERRSTDRLTDRYCQTKLEYIDTYMKLTSLTIITLQYGLPFLIVLLCNMFVLVRMHSVANELYSVHDSTKRNFQFFTRLAQRINRFANIELPLRPAALKSNRTNTNAANPAPNAQAETKLLKDTANDRLCSNPRPQTPKTSHHSTSTTTVTVVCELQPENSETAKLERTFSVKPIAQLSIVPALSPCDSTDSIATADSPVHADDYQRLKERIGSLPISKPGKSKMRRVQTESALLNEVEKAYEVEASKRVTFGAQKAPRRSHSIRLQREMGASASESALLSNSSNLQAVRCAKPQTRCPHSIDGGKPAYLKRKATKILLSITFAFVIFHTPSATLSCLMLMDKVRLANLTLPLTILRLLGEIATIASFTMNLFFYILWGKSYRTQLSHALKRVFLCEKIDTKLPSANNSVAEIRSRTNRRCEPSA